MNNGILPPNIKDYCNISAKDLSTLDIEVRRYIEMGFIPFGEMKIKDDLYIQTVIKQVPPDPNMLRALTAMAQATHPSASNKIQDQLQRTIDDLKISGNRR